MIEKKIIPIFGKRGSGKSFLVKKLIESEKRLLIFDTLGEYTNGVVFEDPRKLLEFWRNVYRKSFRLIYRPLNPQEELDPLAELVFDLGNMTMVIEEIDCYCTPYEISDAMAHIIQRGRHQGITLIGVTQRPFGIHRLITSQAKEIYVFNTNEPRDRDYLRMLLGTEIDAKLDALQQYQYVKWTDGKEQLEIGKA